jgi:hypothetical protein
LTRTNYGSDAQTLCRPLTHILEGIVVANI